VTIAHRHTLALALTALLLAAACSDSAGDSNPAHDNVACTLLTEAEIAAVVGTPLPQHPPATRRDCVYGLPGDAAADPGRIEFVSVSLIAGTGDDFSQSRESAETAFGAAAVEDIGEVGRAAFGITGAADGYTLQALVDGGFLILTVVTPNGDPREQAIELARLAASRV